MYTLFTDGSSRGNPGPGGWGIILADDMTVKEFGGREKMTTNNRMELTALIEGMRRTPKTADLAIHLDSQYVKKGATEWLRGWVRNGWVTASKQPVENQDLWEVVEQILMERSGETTWVHVRGHAGVPGNDRVDEIATTFADDDPTPLFDGKRSEYAVDLTVTEGTEVPSKKRSSAKAFSYVSAIDGKVEVHSTWGSCEARVKGKNAKFRKVFSQEEQDALVTEWKK